MWLMGSGQAPVIKTAQQRSWLGGLNGHPYTREENCDGSAALANAPGFKRNYFTPRRAADKILGDFFRKSEHQLASAHLGPDFVGTHAGVNPQHHEIVQQIGAFLHHGFGLAVHCVDDDLDGLFREFLGHLCATCAQKPGCSRFRRIRAPDRDHGIVKPGDRISHQIPEYLIRTQNRLTHVTASPMAWYSAAITVIAGLTRKIGPKSGDSARNGGGAGWP